MPRLTAEGNVLARCPRCQGAMTSFEWRGSSAGLGAVQISTGSFHPFGSYYGPERTLQSRLYRCPGCGLGAIGYLRFQGSSYPPDGAAHLLHFFPDVRERLQIPEQVPPEVRNEFAEAEKCLEASCHRAAAALFRSVLEKAMRANGFNEGRLIAKIDAAVKAGVLTPARGRRAHEEIRALGNDVLHSDWVALTAEDVEPAHHYSQRVLEDLYDDREQVVRQLVAAGRLKAEEGAPAGEERPPTAE